ncbi:flagellar protein FlaG [Anoxybacillus calidus]|uniref:Flagellar protein FlaG n=1 Tax=[Anoxybacillus] calidus TaxID=575178 RepID=A0A7V9YZI7_9BACL|nr:flagellar protein FlaG [Anoxybacillus calidus]MBA2871327.1 flagellar protein FlaG [Anoxybacillus calidus]
MAIERISSQPSHAFYESTPNQQRNIKQSVDSSIVEGQNETQEVSKEKLEEVVKGLNEFLQPSDTTLKFELHDELKEYYVQIVDERTKEVVREIPPKKLLDMYATMMQFVGLIVDKKI